MVVIHSNPNLANQIESSQWLKQGFERHGLECEITADRHKAGDVHVVQGPHYALDEWYGKPNVIWLDRCFYGDSRYDLSIGWLRPDGSRDFRNADKTEPNGDWPRLKPRKKQNKRAMIFTDYGQLSLSMWQWAEGKYEVLEHRAHPAEHPEESRAPLEAIWERMDVAIGHSSTVLVQAVINGLEVISFDPRHVVQDLDGDRQAWMTRLSWAQWHYKQIINGDWIDHLCIQ